MKQAVTRTIALLGLTAALGLGACHTVAGAGTDIKKTGNAIENSADKSTPR